ncbi:DUF2948 family protein [Tabrizicola sp.]|jgi:hypothetical protein|uniref:DUF2948 family protein n=1 Tax=Tabrizicola sp. TaxID=2005166 RepID=UPI000BC918F5|nr:DUF2948 family protein [Tabrizicola sp.]MBY0350154.1 DUF2948 family protein [Tabrizicola sp.]MDK2774876.1 DUF2948 family protein [Tabrizicola sp.]OYX21373.1 MAG: hypothetical protein B7Z04_03185 [Rhodobacterales bacterium 32-66-9]
MTDARFEEGGEGPLRLVAQDAEDLRIISTLVQDAVLSARALKFDPRRRRFALLLNRFRWEDREQAQAAGRAYERVRSLLVVEDVRKVQSMGFDRGDGGLVLSLLSISFEPGADGTGRLSLTLAGDGAIALEVEALEVRLDDVTRPYRAPSGRMPRHD